MKTKRLIFTVLMILGISMYYGCGKYEDGPAFSLKSKKARITNKWRYTNVERNGNKVSWIYSDEEIDIKEDFTYRGYYPKNIFTESDAELGLHGGFSVFNASVWEFSKNNEDFIISNTDGTSSTFQIIKLTSKELWFQKQFSGDTYKFYLEASK